MKNVLSAVAFWLLHCSFLPAGVDSIAHFQKSDLDFLHSYIDSLVVAEMEQDGIPGSVVVVVQNGQKVFSRGYGFADVEREIKVDPSKTGFRIASLTKTFTATAIMQLVEKGQLDLHAPISQYLPDGDFGFLQYDPMTVHQLLTHTAGIDLTDIGDAARRPEDVVSLEEFVRHHIPAQVHPPGAVHSYSNFGYTILGYLIQAVSGQSYESYIQDHILTPLQMNGSDLSQPLAAPFRENLSKSYSWDGGPVSIKRDYTNTVPGGGIVATADDMSRYILMHLHEGTVDSVRILGRDAHRVLTSQQYGSESTNYGVCYSFFENGWTGRRSLDHTGAQLGFLSMLLLIPDTGTGIFIAQNRREDVSGFRFNLTRAILDTMLVRKPREVMVPGPSERLKEIASNYTGRYQQMNYPHRSYEKLGVLFGFYNSAYVVRNQGDGYLALNGTKYAMVHERLFQIVEENNPWNVEFILDDTGRANRIVAGTTSYLRTPWYASKKVWQRALAAALLVLILHLLQKPSRAIYRKIQNKVEKQKGNVVSKWLYLCSLLLVVGLLGIFAISGIYRGQLADYGVPFSFKVPLLLNTLGAIAALYAPFAAIRLWRYKEHGTATKLWMTLVILAVAITVIGYGYHNVIGFQF